MLKVLMKAPALSMSGYGEQARFLLRSIRHRDDIDLYLVDIPWGKSNQICKNTDEFQWIREMAIKTGLAHSNNPDMTYDVSLQVTIPNEWENIAPVNIGYTAGIECDRVSPLWIQKANQMSKILTISEHSKLVFTSTKYEILNQDEEVVDVLELKTPIESVNYSIRNTIPSEEFELELDTKFNFLTMAQFGPRKNLKLLIDSFVKQFHDNSDVGLVVKTHILNPSICDKSRTKNMLNSILSKYPKRECKIYLLHGEMTENELASLYQHKDIGAFVSTTHGEGFGLPLFESVCNGLPVIVPGWSGHMDFLQIPSRGNKVFFRNIPFQLAEVGEDAIWESVIEKGSLWAHVKESDVMTAMRDVYRNHKSYKRLARDLKEHVLGNFKEDSIFEKINNFIFDDELMPTHEIDLESLKEEILSIECPKQRAKALRKSLQSVPSQKDKLSLLKGSFEGEKCYVLSCGPSLLENDQERLKKATENNLTITIKQAYDLFSETSDLHVYNCANFKKYSYTEQPPIVVEASSTPYKLAECDIKFFIQERDFNKSISVTNQLEEWTYEKQPLLRPYGPGIMYEAVFYLLEHLGVAEVVTVGWDNKLSKGSMAEQHFYDKKGSKYDKSDFIHSNEVAENITRSSLDHEIKITSECIGKWHSWLKNKGCNLMICSPVNPAPAFVERVTI